MKSVIKAFVYAFAGIKEAFITELSFKLEILIGIPVAIIFSWYFWPLHPLEIFLVVIACLLVLMAELFNTSIENIWDLLHPEQDSKVKISKDVAAAAVFMALLISLSVAVLIAYNHRQNNNPTTPVFQMV